MGGAISSLQADDISRVVLCLNKMTSAVWGMTQLGILIAVPSVLSTEPPAPDSPQASLVDSAIPLPEPKVSGCRRNFVHWSFKRVSVSEAVSPCQIETLLLFTAGCYLDSSLALLLLDGDPSLGFRPLTLLMGKPLAAEISLQNFRCCLWELSQTFHTSFILPTSLVVVNWFLLFVLGH